MLFIDIVCGQELEYVGGHFSFVLRIEVNALHLKRRGSGSYFYSPPDIRKGIGFINKLTVVRD